MGDQKGKAQEKGLSFFKFGSNLNVWFGQMETTFLLLLKTGVLCVSWGLCTRLAPLLSRSLTIGGTLWLWGSGLLEHTPWLCGAEVGCEAGWMDYFKVE